MAAEPFEVPPPRDGVRAATRFFPRTQSKLAKSTSARHKLSEILQPKRVFDAERRTFVHRVPTRVFRPDRVCVETPKD